VAWQEQSKQIETALSAETDEDADESDDTGRIMLPTAGQLPSTG
jgi:hypothetical protein